jgi:hypothetical protein
VLVVGLIIVMRWVCSFVCDVCVNGFMSEAPVFAVSEGVVRLGFTSVTMPTVMT